MLSSDGQPTQYDEVHVFHGTRNEVRLAVMVILVIAFRIAAREFLQQLLAWLVWLPCFVLHSAAEHANRKFTEYGQYTVSNVFSTDIPVLKVTTDVCRGVVTKWAGIDIDSASA